MEDESHFTLEIDVILDFASPERSAQDHTRRGPRVGYQPQISHEQTFFFRRFPPPHGTRPPSPSFCKQASYLPLTCAGEYYDER